MTRDDAGHTAPLRRYTGCLLGGAVGDALGAPVEFLILDEIRERYGPRGIQEMDTAYGRRGAITDDTQMTLFTAEGILRATTRAMTKGICHPPSVVRHAYLRWLHTQQPNGSSPLTEEFGEPDGWLIGVKELHQRRAPGHTCISGLRAGRLGTMDEPLNDSKGCGGVMRMAPAGLIRSNTFQDGCEFAALTHGHPSGYLAAGYFAYVIRLILDGRPLHAAAAGPMEELIRRPDHDEVCRAVESALEAADAGDPSPARVESLGAGWVAEEALAIALYCALVAGDDFERGVRLAVNHSGDSDSTGAMTGNLLGAALGEDAIPARWLEELELREVVRQVAVDLHTLFEDSEGWWGRYPGW